MKRLWMGWIGLSLICACAATDGRSTQAGAFPSTAPDAGGASGSGGDMQSNASGASAGDNSAGATSGWMACASDTFVGELAPSALMFQVDTSRSMNCALTAASCLTADPTNTPNDSRWDVFRATMISALMDLPDSLAAGLMRYPNPDTGCAPTTPLVAIGPLSTTRSQINTQLNNLSPDYITPTRDAVRAAFALLRQRKEGNRYVVLATDGAASVCLGCDAQCANAGKVPASESDALVADVKAAFEQDGIRTFVIGVPGSQTYRAELSRVAKAGATARLSTCTDSGPEYCHYDLTSATTNFGMVLGAALKDIGGSVLSCEFAVPEKADFDPNKVNVNLTSGTSKTELKRDPKEMNGWNYTPDGKKIRLFGQACESAKKVQVNGKIDIVYGCPTLMVL